MFGSFDGKQQCFGPSACSLGLLQKPRRECLAAYCPSGLRKTRVTIYKDRNGKTGIISFWRKDSTCSLRSEGHGRVGRHRDVGFPQKLYTRTFGDPDKLFVPLLEAARDANKMLERLIGLGEERGNAVTLSGMQLASSLLLVLGQHAQD
jgi:hypothetical protein